MAFRTGAGRARLAFDAANQEIRRPGSIDPPRWIIMWRTRSIQCELPRRPGDDIGVARESFRGAVNDHLVAERDGILQDGSGESVVDDGDELCFRAKAAALRISTSRSVDWWAFRRIELSNAA